MSAPPNPAPPESADPIIGQEARLAAIAVLQAGLERRGGFDEALTRPPFSTLPPRDRAWARGLAVTALRRLGPIDKALGPRLKRPPPEAVVAILRLGAAQLLYRDTPAFAAVSTSVALADADKATRPYKGLVNAVLRGLSRGKAAQAAPEDHLPPWLFARWSAAYGPETAKALAACIPDEPPTDLTLRDPREAEALTEGLDAVVLPGGTLRSARRGELHEWPGFEEGRWWVQDFAAAIPARLFHVKQNENIADLCAAPGGKTLQLAAAGARVTAVDRSAPRLKRLTANLERMGLEAEVAVADAADWADPRTFDGVLLDAPCSSTGTFRRHPDVLWGARPGDLGRLTSLQGRLLDSAARRVRPGGRLVYCVCSLEPEEGESQVAGFLARHSEFRLVPVEPGEGGAPAAAILSDGTLRLLPSLPEPAGGMDGFFVARFERRD